MNTEASELTREDKARAAEHALFWVERDETIPQVRHLAAALRAIAEDYRRPPPTATEVKATLERFLPQATMIMLAYATEAIRSLYGQEDGQ